jgi:uncharacterized damage-inducible protein DinB
MISLRYARTMAAYNRWMNERLYTCCGSLSDTERKRDVGAFFKSIHGTLNHLLLADRIWLGRFTGEPFVATSLDQQLFADFGELRVERCATDAAIDAWVSSLSNDALEVELAYTTVVNPQPKRLPLWLAAVHFFNHQTHHRGQLTTLLRQRGIDPGVTDLLWLPDVQAVSPRP